MRARRQVADHHAGDIDRQKSRAVRDLREAEDHQRGGGDEGRVQPLRQRDLVERQHHQPAADHPDDETEHGFPEKLRHHMADRALAHRDQLDQHQGEKHREWIVGAGFHFQRGADARPQPQPLRVHQQKHRGGVSGGDHGADQQRLGPVQVERESGDRRGDQRGRQHAEGRQRHRRHQHRADALETRFQPAVEQDQRQRHRSDGVGRADVVEVQPPGPRIARQNTDEEEHQQQWRAEPQREQARQNSGHDQHCAEKNRYADGVEGCHGARAKRWSANTCNCILIVAIVRRQPISSRQRRSIFISI